MKSSHFVTSLLVAAGATNAAAEAYLFTYFSVDLPRSSFIFRTLDPCDPEGARTLVTGDGYTAEIWYAAGVGRAVEELVPLAFSRSGFSRSGTTTLGIGIRLDDRHGGDFVTLQMRVWENQSGAIQSWEEALGVPEIAKGTSRVVGDYILGGLDVDGNPHLGTGSFHYARGGFTISAVCPEPSAYVLLGLAGGLVWWIKKR